LDHKGALKPAWNYRQQSIGHKMTSPYIDRLRPENGFGLPTDYANLEESIQAGGEETSPGGKNAREDFWVVGSQPIRASDVLEIVTRRG
jgi:hypothetical protein